MLNQLLRPAYIVGEHVQQMIQSVDLPEARNIADRGSTDEPTIVFAVSAAWGVASDSATIEDHLAIDFPGKRLLACANFMY